MAKRSMKNPRLHAERWLRQAEHDLTVAQGHLAGGDYSDCCFMSEQTTQKALKALLFAKGERVIPEHSIVSLMKRVMAYDSGFQPFLEAAGMLDQYYIPTRYPDALAEPAVPFESYTGEQATRASAFAKDVLSLVQQRIS